MADWNPANDQSQGSAGIGDVTTQLSGIVRNLSALIQLFRGKTAFGSFTLAAAVTTTVPDAAVLGTSNVSFTPLNAAAATLLASAKNLYVSAKSPGVSFSVSTANGVAAVGTEQFSYLIQSP